MSEKNDTFDPFDVRPEGVMSRIGGTDKEVFRVIDGWLAARAD